MDMFNYIVSLNKVRAKYCNKPQRQDPSWVRITTITMISKFDKEIDINAFRSQFKSTRIRPKNSTGEGFIWSMKETAFYNQITIWYSDNYSTKNIKLFPNGSIQAAGCTDLIDCQRILAQLVVIVKKTLNLDVKVEPPKICMINTNFSLNSSVNLNKVIKVFSGDVNFKVTFDPDRYSAVKVKFVPGPNMKQVTASIFKTGKIIVTGAQTLGEIVAAYDIINTRITPDTYIQPAEKPELFDVIMGAKFEEWVQKIK